MYYNITDFKSTVLEIMFVMFHGLVSFFFCPIYNLLSLPPFSQLASLPSWYQSFSDERTYCFYPSIRWNGF